jgi:PAS domain S-box-containing protein
MVWQDSRAVISGPGADGRDIFPSQLIAGDRDRRLALTVVLISATMFLAAAPFAKTALPQVWAFIPVYQSALVISDLITAALLFGQFGFLRSGSLLALASGYVFSAAVAAVHMLTFPGLFSPSGLLAAGPQSTAWLYMFWHAGFPLFVIAYALLKTGEVRAPASLAVTASLAAVVASVGALTLVATVGHDALPAIMQGQHYTPTMASVVSCTWLVTVVALVLVWRCRPRTVLDLWLIVVMCAWVFDVAIAAMLNAGRFDLGFYAGRTYGLLAASFVLVVLLSENGKLYARLIEAHERTRRLSSEREAESQRRVTAIVDASDDAIVGLDLSGMITSWNSAAERMFGYRANEAIGQSIMLIVPPDREVEETGVLDRLRQGQRIDHFETVRRTRDGRLINILLTVSPLRDATGRVFGASKTARDITERKEVQEALRQSEATALAFIQSAAEGILIVDEHGRIVVANNQIEKMFGYAARELVGQAMEVLLPERVRDRHVAHRADYAAEPRVRPMGRGLDLSGRRRDGTEFPVEISLSYVRTARGVRVMAFITDITERVTLERAARQSEKLAALGTLSAGIAHELNNPLGIISSRIELMLLETEDEPLPATVRDDLGAIHRQTQRVSRLVAGLLSYARPTASQRRLVDVNRVVDEVLLLAQKQLSRHGVRISATLDRSVRPIGGDESALQQVLINLMTNAQQAIDGTGEVLITTRPAGNRPGWVEVLVADTGHGIPAEHRSKIFDPYFTTKQTGTGLGLSITHRIVEEHGGTIEVHSRPGGGTEFVLSFPLVTGTPTEP